MNYKQVLNMNFTGGQDSFLGLLHEESYWDVQKFLILTDAIATAGVDINAREPRVFAKVNKINSYILNSIISHMDPNDLFKISNFDESDIRSCIERLNVGVQYFFEGEPINEAFFDDSLREKYIE